MSTLRRNLFKSELQELVQRMAAFMRLHNAEFAAIKYEVRTRALGNRSLDVNEFLGELADEGPALREQNTFGAHGVEHPMGPSRKRGCGPGQSPEPVG